MALKLRVISEQHKVLGADSSRMFGVTGGRIGRALDNDWVLPDPERYVSSHHAKVSFQAGQWVLEDVSTNGIFVNDSDTALSVVGPRKLKDGDRLRFGDYDILVNIDDRNDFPPDSTGQMPHHAATPPKVKQKKSSSGHFDNDLGEELDITGLFQTRKSDDVLADFDPPATSHHSPPAASQPPRPAVVPAVARPEPIAPAQPVDNGRNGDNTPSGRWHLSTRRLDKRDGVSDVLLNQPAKTVEASREPAKRADSAESQNAFDSFCRGAGIDMGGMTADSQAAVMTLAGQMLREAMLDLIEALKSRPELAVPEAPNTAPNPIKGAASVEDILKRLLQARSTRQLGAVEALRDAFGELRDQRVATEAATQLAINDLLYRLDPNELQERFERGLKRTAIPAAAYKSKYWDLFVEFYPLINQRDARNLPAVYADEFARKYADKLAELAQRRRK